MRRNRTVRRRFTRRRDPPRHIEKKSRVNKFFIKYTGISYSVTCEPLCLRFGATLHVPTSRVFRKASLHLQVIRCLTPTFGILICFIILVVSASRAMVRAWLHDCVQLGPSVLSSVYEYLCERQRPDTCAHT